jgi:hypothetical protein
MQIHIFVVITLNKCIKIRIQIVLAFIQLRVILAAIKDEPTEGLKKELAKWLRYMEELSRHSISILDPTSPKGKSGITL